MGAPVSSLIAEIFLQQYEDANIEHLLDTKKLAYYARYVDILIMFDTTKINLHTVNTYISNIHSNVKLNTTYEEHNSIDFLDLTISRQHKKLEIDIYRKPTATDTTINFLSNHPIEQKTAAYRYHITRMHSLPLDRDKKRKEWKTIQTIAKNNNIPQQLLQKLNQQILQKTDQNSEKKDNKIWTTFTYHSPKIRTITDMFKNTHIGIAFRTTTTLHQRIRPKKQTPITDHERSSVYKITCNTCCKAYVGQTSRNLKSKTPRTYGIYKERRPMFSICITYTQQQTRIR